MNPRSFIPRCLAVAASVALLPPGAVAQQQEAERPAASPTMPSATPLADRLMEQVRVLSANPRNLEALLVAGETSVRLSDPVAAMGFFARAEQISPRNPRALAGRATALVAMERPGEALWLFREAEQRGQSIDSMALDRGLAFDLLGRPDLAQRDYRLTLSGQNADEAIRRLTLSLGISGNLAEATRLIDPLLRRNDRSAWRAWACVLAMNGDTAQAKTIAAGSLPGFGPSLAPFFDRLASLSAADRAHAVHFGTLAATSARRADIALAPDLAGLSPQSGTIRLASLRLVERERPVETARREVVQPLPVPTAVTAPGPAVVTPATVPKRPVQPVRPVETVAVVPVKPVEPARTARTASTTPSVATVSPPPVDVAAERAATRADLAAIIARLAGDADPTPQPIALPERTAKPMVVEKPAAAKPITIAEKPKPKPAPPKPDPKKLHPARIWVQVGVGADEGKLPYTWRQFSRAAPEAFRGKKGGYTAAGRTNRLLVGPFATNAQARAFLAAIKKKDMDGFQWTSAAGQEIETLAVQ